MKLLRLVAAFAAACVVQAFAAGNGTAQKNSTIFKAAYGKYNPLTPVFQNVSGVTANPLIKVLTASHIGTSLSKRQNGDNGLPEGTCAPGTPCSNGACCSDTGICGYSPDECGDDVCLSNCDAKAECGQYSEGGTVTCPLNVCCSFYGFCGTGDEFCTTSGEHPCQDGYGSCGDSEAPSCSGSSATGRRIGYYEGWSTTRQCDSRFPEDLDLTGLTHLNFAFVYFNPSTFEMTPMSASDVPLYTRFTDLKSTMPSLETWVSVGGWAFNDETNVPNTRTAFSDMAKNAANRKAFIDSLVQFMQTYGFDGVDLDWEYPGADDRGGVEEDTANFVTLLKEMRETWGSTFGISATVPSSYWYLRWFDVEAMQDYLDWFNVMSYDIHGVWDKPNKVTGPYVRPHTNITEIEAGLSLLWRAGVNPDQVILGLGWYGRSFTLSDPGCTTPGCVFTEGGKPGECSNSAGTLTNAEINRIIKNNGLTPVFDEEAAVKYISWDSDQWVSYDDGPTFQMKIQRANELCLGGTMIWAVDQDDDEGTSANDMLGIGESSGYPSELTSRVRQTMADADAVADISNSCYWSLCGGDCVTGYFPVTQARGQVAGVSSSTICTDDSFQNLCCAPGTTMGTCAWEGWGGAGMSCGTPACNDSSAIAVAGNTNHLDDIPELQIYDDQTCNGGIQLFCCVGFKPSTIARTSDLNLIGQTSTSALRRRGASSAGGLSTGVCLTAGAAAAVAYGAAAFFSGGLLLLTATPLLEGALGGLAVGCLATLAADGALGNISPGFGAGLDAVGFAISIISFAAGRTLRSGASGANPKRPAQDPASNPSKPKKPKVVDANGAKMYGRYALKTYDDDDDDCQVAYTCLYGVGFDEICDNQKWAIDKGLNGKTVYGVAAAGARNARGAHFSKDDWSNSFRTDFYRTLAVQKQNGEGTARCQVDEFPLASLDEGLKPQKQIVRLVNGKANGLQGSDWYLWQLASYLPCSALRKARGKPKPPVTWRFGDIPNGDNRNDAASGGSHFIQKYGFDSQTANSECWATYKDVISSNAGNEVTVHDHGFRALPNDPMFVDYDWPAQDYWSTLSPYRDPIGALHGVFNPATNIASADWLKRDVMPAMATNSTSPLADLEVIEVDMHGMALEDLNLDPDIFTQLHLDDDELADLGMNGDDIVLLKRETAPVPTLIEPRPNAVDVTTAVSPPTPVVERSRTGAVAENSAPVPTGQLWRVRNVSEP